MINKFILVFLIGLSFTKVEAQFVSMSGDTLYGNEWINHEQEYFKIAVSEDGIYRIPFQELESAGIPIESIEGENFQIFKNGQEYPIYTSSEGIFDESDFIEFYGRKNRGELDRIFYEDPETMQLNPEFSLFTDTAAYFITWNNSQNNLRVKKVKTDLTSSTLPVEDFYMHKERLVQNNRIHKPTRNGGDNVRYSHFDVGEGFGGRLAKKNEVTLNASNIFESGDNPFVNIRFTSNATFHSFNFLINGDLKNNWEHSGYVLRNERVDFDLDELRASNKITLEGTVDEFDRNIIAIVDLNYPRTFDFENREYYEFYMSASTSDKRIKISSFKGESKAIVYDPATQSRIETEVVDGNYEFILPTSDQDRTVIIYNSERASKEVSGIEKIDFINFGQLDHDYIIISHPRLMAGPTDKVAEYASYRSSAAGGSFNPIVVNVEDLYEQFSYGILRHSYSIKNFVNWVAKNWTDPKYVFLIGKGREYPLYRSNAQIQDPLNASYYLPTFGYPGSDNLLTSNGSLRTTHVIPSGRLAAKNSNDVDIYLEKVKEHEAFEQLPQTIEDKQWKKRIMHLAGAETTLQESIGSYLDVMAELVENNQYGARVTTYKKSSTETIQEADAEGLLETIDKGLSVLTFFGHSSVGTFDFNIDDVNKLNNRGKYPLVLSLGCFSGNIHTSSYGISEQYIETRSKGGIAFIASSSTAYVPPQGNFGIRYYDKLGTDYYGRSLGAIFTSTLEESDALNGIHSKILNEQMTLHGDPSIILNKAEGPDFVFDYQSFATEPSVIESNASDFKVSFKVANLGQTSADSLDIKLQHLNGSGEIANTSKLRIQSPEFDTLITVVIPTNGNTNVGRNTIIGELDADNNVVELPSPSAEDNNTIVSNQGDEGFAFFAINNSAEPVAPCDFGIYNLEEVVLRASTFNALASTKTKYLIEVDTSGNFDSALKLRTEVETFGGLIEWAPDMTFVENEVYYWRISPDSVSPEIGYKWEDASFIYLPGSENGWNQSHYYQFLDNDYDGIILDTMSRDFVYSQKSVNITLHNKLRAGDVIPGIQYDFGNIALSIRPWNYLNSGVGFYVIDEEVFTDEGVGWINDDGKFGSVDGPFPFDYRCFAYPTDTPENRKKIIDFVQNVVPEGAYVFFFTVLRDFSSDLKVEEWEKDIEIYGTNIFETFAGHGALLMNELIDLGSVPYSFVFQKGREVLGEKVGESKDSYVKLSAFVSGQGDEGSFTSTNLGPASSWKKITLKSPIDSDLDTFGIEIIGIRKDKSETHMKSVYFQNEIDIQDIDANEYPELKLNFYSKDQVNNTPAEFTSWKAFYEGLPDFAINTSNTFEFNKDTLFQGEELIISFEIDNITKYPVDSIDLTVVLTDSSNENLEFTKSLSFENSARANFTFKYNTANLIGKYTVSIAINNDSPIQEKTTFNNFGVREFVVVGDDKNPILDVSFDGNKIIDGDLISSSPLINIVLRDENKFLLLDDPSLFQIALITPSNIEEVIDVNDSRIRFIPATDVENNEAKIEFSPSLDEDGIYKLIVQAKDASNNISGGIEYQRSFKVINEQSISNVLNYPNPFSTSTQFIFTLTGSEIPEDVKIQVMTPSGKIVKEIFKEELGILKIGINRTTYKWDGRDDFGNILANGVYLYRVIAKTGGDQHNHYRIDEINTYFKNNLGKMVILR